MQSTSLFTVGSSTFSKHGYVHVFCHFTYSHKTILGTDGNNFVSTQGKMTYKIFTGSNI